MDPTPPSPPPLALATAEAEAEAPPPQNPDNVTYFPPDESPNKHHQVRNQPQAMANFKAFVMAIAASDPKRPLTPPLKTFIENRLNDFFRDPHTPDHPPYAAMIITALKELSEERGSSEESISKFIKSKYDDLPWAHSTFLRLHLWKLCESGEIDVTHEKCYLLGDAITKLNPGQNAGGSRKRERRLKEKRDRPCMEDLIKEENQPKEEETTRTEMEIQVTEDQNKVIAVQNKVTKEWKVFEEHNQPSGEYDEVIVEQDKVEEEQDEVRKVQNQTIILNDAIGYGGCDEKTREQKVHTGVIEEQKQPKEVQNDVSEGKTLSNKGQQIKVIEGKSKYLEHQIEVITKQDKRQKKEIKLPENHSEMAEHQSRVVKGLSWSQIHKQQQQEQEKPQHRKLVIRLRPPIPESASVANVSESLPLDHCHDELAAFIKMLSPTNQQYQNEQQQPVKRRRGRPPKPKPEAVDTSGLLSNSSDLQQKHQARGRPPKCNSSPGQPGQRRRGRPPKLRPEADETTGLSLNSSFHHNPHPQMQQGENLVLGRTPACKSSAGRDVEIHKSSSNSSDQVGEGHERWTQEFKDGIVVIGNL
ncbi:hypothetical protein RHSIM_Rhsim09G0066300 [Rhododendron simsii]|uniref:H15 domain-containing protein n=1 Tax=Rhododendron simsii TaxID=118357 RepID=A0A834GH10_RHOSS|nr:hypothetical protein RHSIM_Rhsim09G0066300 [Rhododendron simsii]